MVYDYHLHRQPFHPSPFIWEEVRRFQDSWGPPATFRLQIKAEENGNTRSNTQNEDILDKNTKEVNLEAQ